MDWKAVAEKIIKNKSDQIVLAGVKTTG